MHGHQWFRAILYNMLHLRDDLQVTTLTGIAKEMLRETLAVKPDIIIADISKAMAHLHQLPGDVPLLISWQYGEEQLVLGAMSSIKASFIVHDAPPAQYYIAIRQIMKGEEYYCSRSQALRQGTHCVPGAGERIAEKYFELAYCLLLGYNTKEIAFALGLSERTVETYRKRLRARLGSLSVAALEHFMAQYGK